MINDAVMIEVENGRHPVIDSLKREQEQYVPNSTSLNVSHVLKHKIFLKKLFIYIYIMCV